MTTMKTRSLAWLPLLALLGPAVAAAQESPKTVVAAAVRQAGYLCNQPKSVKADSKRSTPDQRAWIIRCEKGSYRVKFKSDTGAAVEPISKH